MSPLTLDNSAGPVGVGFYADHDGYTVEEEIALTDARVRSQVTYAIAAAFMLANVLTLAGVAHIFRQDNTNIVAKAMSSADR